MNVLSQELEYKLRDFSNFARKKYGSSLSEVKTDYLRTSDARILVSAYLNDAILVTANIKDFYLYPLLFSSEEETLYDVLNETYVQIPTQAREMILQDADFQALLHELRALKQ